MLEATKNSADGILFYTPMKPYLKHFCGSISPNQVTTLGIVPNVLLVYAVLTRNVPLAVGSIFFRSFFDALDGMVARRCHQQSHFGHVYEHVVDLLSTIGVICAALYTYWGWRTSVSVGIPVTLVLIWGFVKFIFASDPTKKKTSPDRRKKNGLVHTFSLFSADNSVVMFLFLYIIFVYCGEAYGTRA